MKPEKSVLCIVSFFILRGEPFHFWGGGWGGWGGRTFLRNIFFLDIEYYKGILMLILFSNVSTSYIL